MLFIENYVTYFSFEVEYVLKDSNVLICLEKYIILYNFKKKFL